MISVTVSGTLPRAIIDNDDLTVAMYRGAQIVGIVATQHVVTASLGGIFDFSSAANSALLALLEDI